MTTDSRETAPVHTPGPWKIVEREVLEDGSVFAAHVKGGERDLLVAPLESDYAAAQVVAGSSLFGWTARNHADARLISAAPDLLDSLDPETLEAIADEIECFEHSARCAGLRGIAERQRAAIFKALGASHG